MITLKMNLTRTMNMEKEPIAFAMVPQMMSNTILKVMTMSKLPRVLTQCPK